MRVSLLSICLFACSDDFWGTDKDPNGEGGTPTDSASLAGENDADTDSDADSDTDADSDSDTDTDTDSDTDADTDADTDSGTAPDPEDVDDDGDGVSENEGDCDDTDGAVGPEEMETPYNGEDDDCDPATRDDDLDRDGFVGADDCDDTDADISPDESETRGDGADNDCDGDVDEAFEVETVDSSSDVGNPSAVGIDSTGAAHLVYRDSATGTLAYTANDGSGWQKPVEIVSDTEVGESLDLVVDAADQVQIAYTWRSGAYTDLWFGWMDAGGTWDTGYYVDGYSVSGSLNTGNYVSIDVDSTNLPSFAYYDATYLVPVLADYTSFGVAIYTDIDVYWAWTYATGYFTSLAIDSEDYDHVAWFDDNLLGSEGQYSNFNESTVNETVAADAWYTSLQLKSDDSACMAWHDVGQGDLLYSCRDVGSQTWPATTVDRTGNVGTYAQLAFDSADNPWIAYYDASNGDLKVATLDAAGWTVMTVDETGDVGVAPSIAIAPDDTVVVSYYDVTNGRLKVATSNI